MLQSPLHRIVFVFVDGLGLGASGTFNPMSQFDLPGFEKLGSGKWVLDRSFTDFFWPIDATLSVEGLPQSGTGQATLFTGINCARLAGKHYGPYPHSATREAIAEHNMFVGAKPFGEPVFANAYPDRFFSMASRRDRWTVTTRCCLDAGVHIRSLDDLARGRAVAADITGQGLAQLSQGGVFPVDEPTAATRLLALSETSPLVLFEYFLSDKAGHARSMERAKEVLESLDRFILALIDGLEPAGATLIVTSDHGNLEDLSVKTHTRNPVPLAVRGPLAPYFLGITDLTGVTPAIIKALASSRQ